MTDPHPHTCTGCKATFTYRPSDDDLRRCPYCDRLQSVNPLPISTPQQLPTLHSLPAAAQKQAAASIRREIIASVQPEPPVKQPACMSCGSVKIREWRDGETVLCLACGLRQLRSWRVRV